MSKSCMQFTTGYTHQGLTVIFYFRNLSKLKVLIKEIIFGILYNRFGVFGVANNLFGVTKKSHPFLIYQVGDRYLIE